LHPCLRERGSAFEFPLFFLLLCLSTFQFGNRFWWDFLRNRKESLEVGMKRRIKPNMDEDGKRSRVQLGGKRKGLGERTEELFLPHDGGQ
jgi:hypothetical protein